MRKITMTLIMPVFGIFGVTGATPDVLIEGEAWEVLRIERPSVGNGMGLNVESGPRGAQFEVVGNGGAETALGLWVDASIWRWWCRQYDWDIRQCPQQLS
jgi:hypothetical protein